MEDFEDGGPERAAGCVGVVLDQLLNQRHERLQLLVRQVGQEHFGGRVRILRQTLGAVFTAGGAGGTRFAVMRNRLGNTRQREDESVR